VGASGSVYGVLLGFAMLFPQERLIIFPIPVPIRAKWMVIGYACLELYLGVSNNPSDNVAHFAHLGGMVFGFILLLIWKKQQNRRRHEYYQ
jgi:membrane associated rhomboid family serine protease